MNKPATPLHIFFAGQHTASNGTKHHFSEADVADLVNSYDPAVAEAQLVVGHPKIEDPSYGGIASLTLDDNGVHATPHNVDAQFAGLVNAGRFPSISASIYRPNDAGNPKPGHFYLRHVGFLGAQPPSLKGLKRPTLNFAENDGALEFAMPLPNRVSSLGYYLKKLFQGLRDKAIETDGAEKADQQIPQWCIDGITEVTIDYDQANAVFAEAIHATETPMNQPRDNDAANFAERETQLATRTAEIEQREQALKSREAEAQREDAVSFAESIVREGKVLPHQKPGMVELLLAFPKGTVLNFAEANGQAATDHDAQALLRNFLTDLPKRVDFSEKSGDHSNATYSVSVDFAAPEGAQVDAGRMELHAKAMAYQRQHPGVDYMTAIKAAG